MGYRSDICIAINKEVLARNLITEEIPDYLGVPENTTDNAAYYYIDGWKWYDSYPEIQELEAWFASMDHGEFGVIRIGEDGTDVQEWGCPHEFEIYVNSSIAYPGN